MASLDNPKVAAILQDFEKALEDLTFNSKPLINDLTMAAEKYKPIAKNIVKKIEERVLEVASFLSFKLFSFCSQSCNFLCVWFALCILVLCTYSAVLGRNQHVLKAWIHKSLPTLKRNMIGSAAFSPRQTMTIY